MEHAEWPDMVNAILYRIQFEKALDERSAEKIARELVTEPLWSLTADDEHTALAHGLQARLPLPSDIPNANSETDTRLFLNKIVESMDALRPWPDRAFTRLPMAVLPEFLSRDPIAVVRGSVNDIEARISCIFDDDPEFGEVLLVRLCSGTEIGFLHPFESGLDTTAITSVDPSVSARAVIDELTLSTRLTVDMFITSET
ncbi:hypothetical protein [Nocardia mangyaensis]|uniref:hypothetical protein n=1 Tax=Nocardia mangyaensis TaxID=2213200 RepID=UPI002675920A|nr:hypothetical protein [Nocardia mangyaensis]MDO3648239.1 hypothetical protein [Nocardia mangyaensis]